LIRSYL